MAMMLTFIFVFTFILSDSQAIRLLEKRQLRTCPGFPGYCSEAYPGDICTVVCAFGRPNVPECQADGTWTDVPRCIEHDPGKEEQIPGMCPGIPGYCSNDRAGGVCEFDCLIGPDIRSFCTQDGTWEPYPTCQGDIRDTRDGCDSCPGPFGGPRNRTAESGGGGGGGRKSSPSQPSRPVQSSNRKQSPPRRNQATSQASRPQRPQRPKRPQAPRQQARPVNNRRGNNNRQNGNKRPQSQPLRKSNNGQPKQQQRPRQQPKQQQQRPNSVSSGGSCPGGALEMCIDVCPSFSARIFGACVAGCAKRCPAKK